MTKTDVQLKRDINQELAWDPKVNAAQIAVSVDQGAVTLLGNVDTYWEKRAAEEAIKRVAGVRTVAQDLTVNVLDGHKRNDSDIAAAVQRAFQWDVTVPDTVTAVVRNGSVTLSGQVTWNYQREAADHAIRSLKGVVEVSNAITLEKLDVPAAQVKENVEAALQRRATGEANSIHVDTSGGKVTLTGHASSWRSMADAEDAAWATPGVTQVVDRLQIALNL
jgi:osmotically-inducible protein OsmY